MSPLQAAYTVAGSCYAGPSSSHLNSLLEGTCWSGCCPLLPGEPGCTPKALLLLCVQGQHLNSEQSFGRHSMQPGEGGPQRTPRISLQVPRTRSRTAFSPYFPRSTCPEPGEHPHLDFRPVLSADTLATRHQSAPDQSHQEGRQTPEGASQTWRTNGDSCVTQTPT